MIGKPYVRRSYNRFKSTYFVKDELPEFDDLDFEFTHFPHEWGHVEWDEHGLPHLSLHPETRRSPTLLKATLLHEMIHLKLGHGPAGHGLNFWDEARRIHEHGAYREYF